MADANGFSASVSGGDVPAVRAGSLHGNMEVGRESCATGTGFSADSFPAAEADGKRNGYGKAIGTGEKKGVFCPDFRR